MKELTKTQIAERSKLADAIRAARAALDNAAAEFNEKVGREYEKMDAALTAYRKTIDAANEWTGAIADDIQNYIDERSEAWRDGAMGAAYEDWAAQYAEEFQFDELEAEKPQLDIAELIPQDHADLLEQLPEAP